MVRRLVRPREEAERSPALLSLTATEAQAVADADPLALRALLLPDYARVATSVAELLFRVVERCMRTDQVSGVLLLL